MFKNMGGNIPGGNFPRGNFPGGSLIGGNFSGGSSPDTLLMTSDNSFKVVVKVVCWVQIWKKTFCQNSDNNFLKNSATFLYLLCIYKKPITLSLFRIYTLNFTTYILTVLTCPLKTYVFRLRKLKQISHISQGNSCLEFLCKKSSRPVTASENNEQQQLFEGFSNSCYKIVSPVLLQELIKDFAVCRHCSGTLTF